VHVHSHGHSHAGAGTAKVLRVALVLTAVYIVLLIVAGIRAHSLALLSEAGHNISDFLALLLSWFAVFLEQRPPSSTKTFGYRRAGVIAAFINASSLVVIAVLIFYAAIQRFYHPVEVHASTMMWVAGGGVLLNGVIAALLFRSHRDLNIRSALIHEIGDTLSTAAVILGGWIILATGKTIVDPVLSMLIGGLILWSSFGIIRESLNILLEGTPNGMELDDIVACVRNIRGVIDVHDLHVWSIGSESHALSAHVKIDDIPPSESEDIMAQIRAAVHDSFHIHHTTIQFESAVCDIPHGCNVPVSDAHKHLH
jgi:cobalt-zinc-cadmium efflux system protein